MGIRWRLALAWAAMFAAFGIVLLLALNLFVGIALDGVVDEVRAELTTDMQDVAAERPSGPVAAISQLVDGPLREAAVAVRRATLLSLVVLAAAAGGVGWWLSGRMLTPVRQLTATARRISQENLSARLAPSGPADELRELGEAFDAMLERLERAFEAQRRFAADASHELRTPLTLIRAELDVTLADPAAPPEERQEAIASLRHALEHSEQLLDRLLQLASAEVVHERTPVDLAELVTTAVETHVPDAHELQVDLQLDPTPVAGDDALLARLVDNLIDNAVRHNQRGGWLQVRCTPGAEAARITIANSGRQLTGAEVGRLTEPFYRPDPSRDRATGGSGLGLGIVAAIVRAHDGRLELRPTLGGGLTVEISFPRSTHPPWTPGTATSDPRPP